MINKLIKNSVKRNVLSAVIIPSIAMCLILTAYYMYHRNDTAMKNFHEKGMHIGKSIAAASEYGILSGNKEYLAVMIDKIVDDPEIISVIITEQEGKLFLQADEVGKSQDDMHSVKQPIVSQLVEIGNIGTDGDINLDRNTLPESEVANKIIGNVELLMSYHLIEEKQYALLMSGIFLACFALVLSILAGVKLASSIINPIKKIIDAVSIIKVGNYDINLNVEDGGEIGALVEDINSLSQELELTKMREKKHLMEVTYARDIADKANKEKTNFIAKISHELKSPLTSVLISLDLLKPLCRDEYYIRYFKTCVSAAKHLQNSMENTVNRSMMDIGQFHVQYVYFDIKELVEDSVMFTEVWVRKKDLTMSVSYDIVPELDKKFVLLDPNRLKQILLNLIENAVKYTEQGRIDLLIRLRKVSDEKAGLEIVIQDTGIGIPSDQIASIFNFGWQIDPILSRRKGGLGIGLSIVKELTEFFKGEIKVESQEGQGACFKLKFTCPYSEVVIAENEVIGSNQIESDANKNKKILLIEDDYDIRSTVEMALSDYGYDIDTASNGLEGRNMFLEKDYDVVFIDCYMPKLDGINCARLIRQYEKKQPGGKRAFLVALTAAVGKDNADKCYEAEMDKVIYKPYSFINLINCINNNDRAKVVVDDMLKQQGFKKNEDRF